MDTKPEDLRSHVQRHIHKTVRTLEYKYMETWTQDPEYMPLVRQ